MAGIQIDGVNNKIDFDDDADTSISSATDDTLVFEIAGSTTAQMTNGDFLINTTTAIQPGSSGGLGVKGDINISDFTNDTSSSALVFTKSRNTTPGSQTIVNDDDQVGAIFFKADDGNASDYNNNVAAITASVDGTPGTDDTPGRLVFFTTADGARTNTERMRINRGGRVSIGTTNQDHVFQARGNGDAGTDAFLLANTRTSGSTRGLQIAYSHAPNDTQPFFICEDTSAVRFIVRNTGNVENVNNSYGATSDERVKEQIVDSSSQWNDIKSIKVKKYKMKEEVAVGDSDSLWRLGVIAQDLEESGMNGLVRDEIKYTAEDKEVVEKKVNEGDIKSYKSVKYSVLYMKAIKALQEAQTRIETLETKVAALEGN